MDKRRTIDRYNPDMVAIPAGAVKVGLAPEKIEEVVRRYLDLKIERWWIEREVPRHEVHVGAFSLAKFQVTNAEFHRFVQETGHAMPVSWGGHYHEELADHPVYRVEHQDALDYITWLNSRTGRRYRLPTEIEWEYAATGSVDREFPWGDEFDSGRANTAEAGIGNTTSVGSYEPGPFGLYDMAGNVEEWTSDLFEYYPGASNPKPYAPYYVTRGGSFKNCRDLARCSRRHGPFEKDYAIGFRLAEDAR